MKYSSKDFHKVPSELRVVVPQKLIHKEVLSSSNGDDDQLSLVRKHLVRSVDLPTQTISMTIGGLAPSESSGKHRHNYESVIYIIDGCGRTTVEDRCVEWAKGDAIYIPPWAWHQHTNSSDIESCVYVACENAPLLQNIGDIAVREES